jgi:hypothetical protein
MVDTIKANPVLKFVSDNWFSIVMFSVAGAGLTSVFGSIAQHREDVQAVSMQNAGCIYLESSKLGEGQHYMICNGQITLKRLQEGETTDPEQALEEAIPAATNTATSTPSAATTK